MLGRQLKLFFFLMAVEVKDFLSSLKKSQLLVPQPFLLKLSEFHAQLKVELNVYNYPQLPLVKMR